MLLAAIVAAGTAALALATRQTAPPPKPVPNDAFRSARDARAPSTVWAVGDGADGGDAAKALSRRIGAGRPDRLLYLGDVYERGTAAEFRDRFATVYRGLAARMAPTPGNHDWPNHDTGYDRYWRRVTGAPTPPWYRFRAGGWDIVSLNSEAPHGADSAQLRWLRRRVRAPGTCRLAFWHRPRYSAGSHGDQRDVAPLWDVLRGHAKLIVSGHDHNLQRFRPVGGMTQLVVGAGGHSRYDVDDDDARPAFADDDVDGALRMTLRPGSADLAFVGTDGSILDRSRVTCSPAA